MSSELATFVHDHQVVLCAVVAFCIFFLLRYEIAGAWYDFVAWLNHD